MSKGKNTISRSQLAKWPELQELVAGGLCSEEEVNEYLSDMPAENIAFEDFYRFVDRLQDVNLDNINPEVIENLLKEEEEQLERATAKDENKKNKGKDKGKARK